MTSLHKEVLQLSAAATPEYVKTEQNNGTCVTHVVKRHSIYL